MLRKDFSKKANDLIRSKLFHSGIDHTKIRFEQEENGYCLSYDFSTNQIYAGFVISRLDQREWDIIMKDSQTNIRS